MGVNVTETAETSDALRERVLRLTCGMTTDNLLEAMNLIFEADTTNDGRFTTEQFDRLAAIAATTAGRKVRQ